MKYQLFLEPLIGIWSLISGSIFCFTIVGQVLGIGLTAYLDRSGDRSPGCILPCRTPARVPGTWNVINLTGPVLFLSFTSVPSPDNLERTSEPDLNKSSKAFFGLFQDFFKATINFKEELVFY